MGILYRKWRWKFRYWLWWRKYWNWNISTSPGIQGSPETDRSELIWRFIFLLASARSEINFFVDPEPIGFSPWISEQAYISFDGNLLNDFNQLTDNDLETSLGKIKSSNSLNEYMTKINFCYSENDELIQIHTNDSIASEILLRLVSKIICRKINLSDIFSCSWQVWHICDPFDSVVAFGYLITIIRKLSNHQYNLH